MDKFLAVVLAILAVGTVLSIQNIDRRLDALEATQIVQATPLDIIPLEHIVLVGVGCEDSNARFGVMIGLEEDEFTKCQSIEAHSLAIYR